MAEKIRVEGEYQRKSIPCPECGLTETIVKDSRAGRESTRRRRECLGCGERFSTYEVYHRIFRELEILRMFVAKANKFRDLLIDPMRPLKPKPTCIFGFKRHLYKVEGVMGNACIRCGIERPLKRPSKARQFETGGAEGIYLSKAS